MLTRASIGTSRTGTSTGSPPAWGSTPERSIAARNEPLVSWLATSRGARYSMLLTEPGSSSRAPPAGGLSTSIATCPGHERVFSDSATPA
jgi:hypothetical protein